MEPRNPDSQFPALGLESEEEEEGQLATLNICHPSLHHLEQVAPEPEGSSCHLPKEQSGPSVPTGGKGAPSRARRWKCPAFWRRKPTPFTGTEVGEAPVRPKWSWPRVRLGKQDPAQEGSWAGWLWGLLCGQHLSQEPSPDSQQEAWSCPVTGDLPASPGQKLEDPCPSTSSSARSPWDSSSTWNLGSSEADGRGEEGAVNTQALNQC
ncbi:uncharacterized protein LOC122458488 [Dermochelys coriacea]|uniref:uncharacterized protein LOC122458488 n=1 Tax=Dermochelys coriacea TaxID=27794 RepID=UPI001CA9766D|nr:uncharacterized protein LOC122458488 [Dermochelys coriacea]